MRVEITYAYIITLLLRKGKLFHYSFCEDTSFNLTHYHFKAKRDATSRCRPLKVFGRGWVKVDIREVGKDDY